MTAVTITDAATGCFKPIPDEEGTETIRTGPGLARRPAGLQTDPR